MMRRVGVFSLVLFAMNLLSGCAVREPAKRQLGLPPAVPSVDYAGRSADGVRTLQTWYNPATGLYDTTGWWNSANAITVLVDYARLRKTHGYDSVFATTFVAAQKKNVNFLNKYYDDEGWWALAWIDAYDLTHRKEYLAMARTIFADMVGGWDDTCSGGIWWSKDRKYKNAIANELFLSVAAHLASRTSGQAKSEYLSWSRKEWTWFLGSGMINADHLINDGLTTSGEGSSGKVCRNNGRTVWTYNQGVVLGGLAELSAHDDDPALRSTAREIAHAAITALTDGDGILHDHCEPKCGQDGVQFKGIFARNFVALVKPDAQASELAFVRRNADSIWEKARGPEDRFDVVWTGPYTQSNAATQTSALDGLLAAAALEKAR